MIYWGNYFDKLKPKFLYIRTIKINTIISNITFTNNEAIELEGTFLKNFSTNILGRRLINFYRAPISLPGIVLHSTYGHAKIIAKSIFQRYLTLSNFISMFFVLITSTNVIGDLGNFLQRISRSMTILRGKLPERIKDGPLEHHQDLIIVQDD